MNRLIHVDWNGSMKKFICSSLVFLSLILNSQEPLKGRILSKDGQETIAIENAQIQWINTQLFAKSDIDGNFQLTFSNDAQNIIITHPNYQTDTLDVKTGDYIIHFLRPNQQLEGVSLVQRRKSMMQSYQEIGNIINVSSDELLKAACCTLAESFETNPSIDSYYPDALSGVRQIRMLGLDYNHISLSNENIPISRTISQRFGFSFIPGPQIESIQILKGAGSLTGGFETLGGQINIEMLKPLNDNKAFVNLFRSFHGRSELNISTAFSLNEKIYSSIHGHFSQRKTKLDHNSDGFLDNPLVRQFNLLNRWQYIDSEKGLIAFGSFRVVDDEKKTGQLDSDFDMNQPEDDYWKSFIKTFGFESSLKFGYVNPEIPYRSIGLQLSFIHHDQNSFFDKRTYDLTHSSFYSSLIYSSIISNTKTTFKTGLNFGFDSIDQTITGFDQTQIPQTSFAGSFFEVTHNNLDGLSMIGGLRLDLHSQLGFFVTPRFNLRYQLFDRTQLRFSIGTGRKYSYYIAENQQFFASNREIVLKGNPEDIPINFALNIGGSITQRFDFFGVSNTLTVDYYSTDFQSKTVADWEQPGKISFYQLNGRSLSNSFQIEYNFIPSNQWELRMAYRNEDASTDYQNRYNKIPLRPFERLFLNASWVSSVSENGGQWKANMTIQLIGSQRMVPTSSLETQGLYFAHSLVGRDLNQLRRISDGSIQNTDVLGDSPLGAPLPGSGIYKEWYTPIYRIINAQLNRQINDSMELYIGGENLNSYTQKDPIVAAESPKSLEFDATQVYAPIFGAMLYIGLRWQL